MAYIYDLTLFNTFIKTFNEYIQFFRNIYISFVFFHKNVYNNNTCIN